MSDSRIEGAIGRRSAAEALLVTMIGWDQKTAVLARSKRTKAAGSKPMSGRKSVQSRFQWLDQDQLSQLLADGKPSIAHLADEIGLAGEEPDDLVLAKAEFAQPILQFRSGAKLFDADCHAGFYAGQGTNLAAGFFDAWFYCLQPIHNQLPRISPLRRILTTHFLPRGDHYLLRDGLMD
jgi:hypothetical protein